MDGATAEFARTLVRFPVRPAEIGRDGIPRCANPRCKKLILYPMCPIDEIGDVLIPCYRCEVFYYLPDG
jgi:hypothetical protein